MTRAFATTLCTMLVTSLPAFSQATMGTTNPPDVAPAPPQMGTTAGAPSAAAQLPVAVQTTNQTFRDIYAKAKHDITAALGPVIIVNGEKVILLHGGKRSEEQMIPPNYHLLKTIDHISLGLFSALQEHFDGANTALSAEETTNLQNLKEHALKAQEDLTALNLAPAVLQRQNKLVDDSVAFIDKVLAQKQVSSAELQKYTRGVAPATLENGFEAVSMELSNMNGAVKKWRDTMPASEWRKLYVIVMDGHMPRQQERHMQYFLQLLKEKQEGDHVIYTEGLSDETAAMDVLVTHILDKKVAIAFYKDPWRMHRDFLSDGAKKYLKSHPAGR